MKNFVRGSGIFVKVAFLDKDGNQAMIDGAQITVSYVPKNNTQVMPPRTFQTYSLLPPSSGNDWTLEWDSSISSPCQVDCHAYSIDVTVPIATIDFSFRLTANRANKELAGDDDGWTGYWR